MEVQKLRNYISIVIIADFYPEEVNLGWVQDKGIVFPSEASYGFTKRLERNLSVFKVSKSIEIVCNNERLQVTGLVAEQKRVIDVANDIFIHARHSNVIGIGINAALEFTFYKQEDGVEFGNYFVPMRKWERFFEVPRVLDFTIRDNKDPKQTKRIKSINIRSISPKITAFGNIAKVRMSVNNSISVDREEEVVSLIEKTANYADDFWTECDVIISEI